MAHSADVDVDDSDRLRRRRAHRAVLNAACRVAGEGVGLRTQPHNRFCVLQWTTHSEPGTLSPVEVPTYSKACLFMPLDLGFLVDLMGRYLNPDKGSNKALMVWR